jgi:hypothetical protein
MAEVYQQKYVISTRYEEKSYTLCLLRSIEHKVSPHPTPLAIAIRRYDI